MIDHPSEDFFIWKLFRQLRGRGFPLCPQDYETLRRAIGAGFGCASRIALRDLCCTLWAKSLREQEVISALFDQQEALPNWKLSKGESTGKSGAASQGDAEPADHQTQDAPDTIPETRGYVGLPPIKTEDVAFEPYPFSFVAQYPLSYREVAQAWRRLRQPVREGPCTEIDIPATVERRCRTGIVSEVVLIPRRRNTASLLLLVDQQGSMSPFHGFAQEVCTAIRASGNLEKTAMYFFHNLPAEGSDRRVLESLSNQPFPVLDTILGDIPPLTEGYVYHDPECLSPLPLSEVLDAYADGAVAILSDAGAARGQYNLLRLLDTVAFFKALKQRTSQIVWLNPMPREHWDKTTAGQIARHVPMFPWTRRGMYRAVDVLRGQPCLVECPV